MRVTRTPSRPRILVATEEAAAELERHGVAERLDRVQDASRTPMREARRQRQ